MIRESVQAGHLQAASIQFPNEASLDMGVSEKRKLLARTPQACLRFMFMKHITIFVIGCAMHEIKVFYQDGTSIQVEQPQPVAVQQLVPGPARRALRHRIEGIKGGVSRTSLIVISSNDYICMRANPSRYFIGIRSVTHNIAKTENSLIMPTRGITQDSGQSFPVGVDITQD